MQIKPQYLTLLVLGFAARTMLASPTPLYGVSITFTGTAQVTFSSSSFTNVVCPAGLSGCGGSFQAVIKSPSTNQIVNNANLWCVDYQMDVSTGSNYTANIVSLATPNAQFDNGTQVRYGSASPSQWVYSNNNLGSYTDALSRYQLAATLIMAYQNNIGTSSHPAGGPDFSQSWDKNRNNSASTDALTNRNRAIQGAIWQIMENKYYGNSVPDLSHADISSGVTGGYGNWILWAEANVQNTDFTKWGVVSGNYTKSSSGVWKLDNDYTHIQTFLVELPEPGFYGVVTFGFAALVGLAARKRRRALQAGAAGETR